MHITLEIQARLPDGAPDGVVRTVGKNRGWITLGSRGVLLWILGIFGPLLFA